MVRSAGLKLMKWVSCVHTSEVLEYIATKRWFREPPQTLEMTLAQVRDYLQSMDGVYVCDHLKIQERVI